MFWERFIFSNLNAKKLAPEVNTFIKDHGSNFSLDNLLLSVLYLHIVPQLAKGRKLEGWTTGWTYDDFEESKKVGGRSVSPVTTSSPFLARESLLIGDSAKQLDIKTPYQRGVLNTQHRSESSQSDISRGSPVLTPTSQSSSRLAGHIDRVGLQTANYLDFSLKNKQEVLSSSQTWSSQMVR